MIVDGMMSGIASSEGVACEGVTGMGAPESICAKLLDTKLIEWREILDARCDAGPSPCPEDGGTRLRRIRIAGRQRDRPLWRW